MYVMQNCATNEQGHMTMAGCDLTDIARKYGTPAYVMDEAAIRERCRMYRDSMNQAFGNRAMPLYASKAFCTLSMCRLITEEGLGLDVASGGELYTAIKANFPMERVVMHSNYKTANELQLAIQNNVGRVILDNFEELEQLNELAGKAGKKMKVLLRITPGIDGHTHEKISTGQEDSKFGIGIHRQADAFVKAAIDAQNLVLKGVHCHIGSQIFEEAPFLEAAKIMIQYMIHINQDLGYELSELDLGGGPAVRYRESDPAVDYQGIISQIGALIRNECYVNQFPAPFVFLEPGRSIVADSGVTLYTVGGVKELQDLRNYVSVDGGMTDNPRYALYQAPYELVVANKASKKKDYCATVVGKLCESGDIIQENALIQKPAQGDILAVQCTGAYNYSMASNYNRLPKPPVVMLANGRDRLVVKRESFDDLTRNDLY